MPCLDHYNFMHVCVLVECVVAISPWHECSAFAFTFALPAINRNLMNAHNVSRGSFVWDNQMQCVNAWTILLQQFFMLYPLQVIGLENVSTHFSLFITFNKLYFIVCVSVCVRAMSGMLLFAIILKASQPSKTRVRQNEKKGRIWIPISR